MAASIAVRLHTFDLLLQAALDEALARCGVTMAQWTTLRAAAERPEASSAELARACLVTPQTMHTMVSALERNGLLVRQPHPVHGRVLQIHLSNAGERRLRDGARIVADVEARVLESLSDDDRQALARCLAIGTGALNAGAGR